LNVSYLYHWRSIVEQIEQQGRESLKGYLQIFGFCLT
jgi:hypothetical protein